MNHLIVVDATSAPYGILLVAVVLVGFLAAVALGSIAWYNSKRPAGWESKERPSIVPQVEK